MALTLAERSTLIAPSATLAMAAEAKRLKAAGVDVLDFALLTDRSFQNHYALHPGGSCQSWIHRLRLLNEHRLLDVTADDRWTFDIGVSRWWFRRRRRK